MERQIRWALKASPHTYASTANCGCALRGHQQHSVMASDWELMRLAPNYVTTMRDNHSDHTTENPRHLPVDLSVGFNAQEQSRLNNCFISLSERERKVD